MGVHGLWRLIEPSGKPVPLETLENKVLAVDISIWLHQAVKGFQDSKGASVPNAHLLGIYHRVCKLLYFRIKPIFVFDGGVPALKKQTIAKRTQSKLRNVSEAEKIQKQLLNTLLKHTAVSKVLTEKIEASIGSVSKGSSRSIKDDMYMLPPSELDSTISSSEDESESTTTDSSPTKNWDLHSIDMDSVHFKSLPVDVRHDILTDLKETRKQSSWGRLHELPKVSDDFSIYQMQRLLKRQAVQTALEDAEKEMGGKSLSLAELESILKDQGVITKQNVGNRIASDETTKYLLVKDVKKAIEEARKKELQPENDVIVEETEVILIDDNVACEKKDTSSIKTKADMEYDDDLRKAIALSLECEPSTSDGKIISDEQLFLTDKCSKEKSNLDQSSFLENFTDHDFASSSSDDEEIITEPSRAKMSSAQSYMLEYSGLTPNEIAKIIKPNVTSIKSIKPKLRNANLSSIPENCNVVISTIDSINEKEVGKTKMYIENIDDKATKGKEESIDDLVEIMSSSGSSDSEVDEKNNLEDINIVKSSNSEINKGEHFFANIFDPINAITRDSNRDENVNAYDLKKNASGLDIVVNPKAMFDEEDDIFSDVFSQNEEQLTTKCMDIKDGSKSSKEIFTDKTPMAVKDSPKFTQYKSVKTSENENVVQETSFEILSKDTDRLSLQCIDSEREIMDDKEQTSNPLNKNKEHDLNQLENVSDYTNKDSTNVDVNNVNRLKRSQKAAMSKQELRELKDQLQKDRVDLLNEKSTKERMAGNITDQMYQEAQELLELFGVPYVIAPMEAEAQCAFLDAIDLTDGTITDDSDIWLFGGKTVYKNFFNQSKYVMEFRSENISHHFKLTREQMILLALLVGSDYTVGLQGVGPVTAMEILAAFPPSKGKVNEFSLSHSDLLSGLKEFRSWFTKGKSPGPGRSALKSKLKNLSFTENFPSLQVVHAYLDPTVETSRDAFSWGKPNSIALLEFAREKFGWTRLKTEEILNPVLKRLEESRHQKSIRDYFKTRFRVHSGEAESKMSKRVKSAITNMGRDPSEILAEEVQEELKKQPRKKQSRRKKDGKEAPEFSDRVSISKANTKQENEKTSEENELTNSPNAKKHIKKKTNKVKFDKLKPKSEYLLDDASSTNQEKADEKQVEVGPNQVEDISEKINLIRRRRKIKEAKAGIDVKKPKLTKEKKQPNIFSESVPDDLKVDEEVNLLSQIITQSSQKIEEINKTMQEKLESLETKSLEVFKSNISATTPNQPKPSTSNYRPVSRPTRIPRKESIPQKEKDKSMMLRSKLKAIEVYRRGKHGPGFIPKRNREKRLPKPDAELSENSDE